MNFLKLNECVSIENVHELLVCGKQILATSRVSEQVTIPHLQLFDLSKLIMQDVMDLDLIYEGCSQLISCGMDSHGNKRLCLMTNRVIFQHKVLSRQFTHSSGVVPQSDG